MNDFTQAIGELAQGGLTARALEPTAGENRAASAPGPDGHTHESACLNCGTPLIGTHCHACGQAAHVHRTLGAFFHDLLHGVLHFEGKIWHTLPLLVWRPGQLTREYIDGRRATYVSPIALFLFTIFLLFATFSAMGGSKALTESVDLDTERATQQALTTTDAEIARARERLAATDDPDSRERHEAQIAQLEQQRRFIEAARGNEAAASSPGETVPERRIKSAWQKAKENPQLLIYKLQTNAYKFSWLLIPISVPFVALTFLWRRQFGLYDHTIFATYSITFMIALVFLATLVWTFVSGWAGFAMLLYAPVHMYWQLRGTYALGRLSAFWRLLALSTFAWMAIFAFALILVVLSD